VSDRSKQSQDFQVVLVENSQLLPVTTGSFMASNFATWSSFVCQEDTVAISL